MSMDKKVPEIRFKGFSRKWESLILGENAKFSKGQGYLKGDLAESGSPIILYGRLYTKYQTVITDVDTFVIEKDKTIKSVGGEVIVPASGESSEDISRGSVVNKPNVIIGGDLNIILPNSKLAPIFLALAISNGRLKKILSTKAQGKSVVHIRNSDLADLAIILPSETSEQATIGNYFQKLDTLINQHQQKHDKLCNIKKAMLEKMFPKQGETVPEVRFKGFCGEWEEKELKEICSYLTSSLTVHDAKTKGIYKLYDANKCIGYTDVYFQSTDYITIIKDGAGVGRVRLLPKKSSFIATMGAIKPEDSDLYFLYCCLIKVDFIKHISGGTIPHIYFRDYGKEIFRIPSLDEQTAIGNYFQKLDNLINQHQQQITKLNNIKQACLSKMFV